MYDDMMEEAELQKKRSKLKNVFKDEESENIDKKYVINNCI